MDVSRIDPRHRIIRGLKAIAEYYDLDPQLVRRQVHRGLIDVTQDGRMYSSTPARLDASPLVVGDINSTTAA